MKRNYTFHFGTVVYDLASRTHVMGILNVTPDSFSDGGRYIDKEHAIEHGQELADAGADFIDIGGESTRPGSESVSSEEEIRRVIPVIESLAKIVSIPISIDTYKSEVAEAALQAGACMVNDISAMTFDAGMASVVARNNASIVLMHIKGTPKTMQLDPSYTNVTDEVKQFLAERIEDAVKAGIKQIILDPGIGFGKKYEHNIQLLQELKSLVSLKLPLLVGVSNKTFLGAILNLPPGERMEGTAAAVTVSILHGANIIRVHDVKEMKRVAQVSDALKSVMGRNCFDMGLTTKTLAILIPAFNADGSLAGLVQRLHTAIGDVQIVVVDDGSTDRTKEVAIAAGAVILQHEKNRGKGAALQTGFDYFNKHLEREFILTMDADLQHSPEDVSKFLLAQQNTNADIVIGWRGKMGTRMPMHRKLSNTITSAMVGVRTGIDIKDSQCGFRLIRRSVLDHVRLASTGYEAETEFLLKAARLGYTIAFVPVQTIYGTEKSYMTHWTTTINFIKVIIRNYK